MSGLSGLSLLSSTENDLIVSNSLQSPADFLVKNISMIILYKSQIGAQIAFMESKSKI